jgi:hypothetical protein
VLERAADEDAEDDGWDEKKCDRQKQDTRSHAERDEHLARRISDVVGVAPVHEKRSPGLALPEGLFEADLHRHRTGPSTLKYCTRSS